MAKSTDSKNDDIELRDAKSNPWYRMMTAGEDEETSRRIWNGYVKSQLQNWPTDMREAWLKRLNITLNDIEDWAEGDEQKLKARLEGNIPKIINNRQSIELSNLNFSDSLFVAGFIFPCDISFENSHFQGLAFFGNAQFQGRADFSNAQFSRLANFSNAQFSFQANFSNARFSHWAVFRNAQFSSLAIFNEAQFQGRAYFSNAQFSSVAGFTEGIFKNLADFSKATFDGATRFDNCEFQTQAPEFYGAQLHPDITLPDKPECYPNLDNLKHKIEEQIESNDLIKKSDKSKKVRDAFKRQLTSQKNAYTELRRQMSALHKIDEEQFFLRQEMACQEALEDRGLIKAAYQTFHAFSDYGWSIWRPFIAMIILGVFGALLNQHYLNKIGGTFAGERAIEPSIYLSITSLIPWLSSRRDIMAQVDKVAIKNNELGAEYWITYFGMFQTISGVVLLFLFILALRNRFRLR